MIIDAPSEVFGSEASWLAFLDEMRELREEVTRPDDIAECDAMIEKSLQVLAKLRTQK